MFEILRQVQPKPCPTLILKAITNVDANSFFSLTNRNLPEFQTKSVRRKQRHIKDVPPPTHLFHGSRCSRALRTTNTPKAKAKTCIKSAECLAQDKNSLRKALKGLDTTSRGVSIILAT